MACTLKPECNFLNGYFRCLLPLGTVDVEVKVKMLREIHIFRKDRTTWVIMCNHWGTRFCSYPSLIKKMKTYLELKGKLDPKPRPQCQTQSRPSTSTPSQSNNPLTRKSPGPKWQIRRGEPEHLTKSYRVRVIAHPNPTTPTPTTPINLIPTVPTPTVATTSTQMPMVKSAATSILVMVYNLAKGKFDGVPTQQKDPRLMKILLPLSAIHHNLKLHPRPQPSRSEKTPFGLTPCQHPHLKPGQVGQFPYASTHCERRESRSITLSSSSPSCHGFTQTKPIQF